MKCYKLKTLLVFLILILSIGMVSASENVSTDLDINNGNEQLGIDQELSSDVNVLGENEDSFTKLSDDVLDVHDGIVNLTKNYKFNSNDDDYKEGISISGLSVDGQDSGLTINGNGHYIDGSNLARIFKVSSGTVTLKNIKFINGNSPKEENGGAILLTSGKLIIEDCIFENNHADKHGGAISSSSSYSNNQIQVFDSTFEGNTANFHGGAINSRDLIVDNSKFDSNKVTTLSATSESIDLKGLGGAIYSATASIKNTNFTDNTVKNSGIYQINEGGGAITITNRLTLDNCRFIGNSGLKGGAILAIQESQADLNPRNYVKINNSSFDGNVAFDGGAICSNYNITVNNTKFNDNVATGYGGGAINTGMKSNNNIIENTVFYNNTAENYGGALASSNATIKNCSFTYNGAKHGGAIFSLSFDISDSTFKDNVATYGNNIIVTEGFKIDKNSNIPESELTVYAQDEVHDFTVDVLNGQDVSQHLIETGKFKGYQQYCVEQHLFYPSNTEGVLTRDLTYIVNSINNKVVVDYLKILFYLKDAFPEEWGDYDTQAITWIFTDGEYWKSKNDFVKEIIKWYDDPNFNINQSSYILPNGSKMEYDMQLFLTPTDRQNMVLFKSTLFVPVYNETVSKQTINKTVYIGENVQFRIVVTNTGNMNLTDVFVKDIDYSSGLVYKKWHSEKGKWTYNNKGKWTLLETLKTGDNASFIVEFKTKKLGELRNNVTSGYMNIELANSTNTTKTVYLPKMSVKKVANKIKVKVGEEVSFKIIVKNDGDCDITGVYVVDNEYSDGLIYDYFVDSTNSWSYKGNDRWEYNYALKAHEESNPLILFFLANKTGMQYNTVTAGNNLTNKTVKSKNSTNVTNETPKNKTPHNKTPENKTHNRTYENKTYDNRTQEKFMEQKTIRSDTNATGNPLFALILVLISLGFVSSKRRK